MESHLGLRSSVLALPHGLGKGAIVATNQNTFNIPPPIGSKKMTVRELFGVACDIELSDQEIAELPGWAANTLQEPRGKDPRQLVGAMERLSYLRLEHFRAEKVDWVLKEYDYRVSPMEEAVLKAELPPLKGNSIDRDARNTLLKALRNIDRLIEEDSKWDERATESAPTATKQPAKKPAKKSAAKDKTTKEPTTSGGDDDSNSEAEPKLRSVS